MGILGKLFGKKAPEWAQPISFEDYQEFQDDVIRCLAQVALEAEIDWEEGTALIHQGSARLGFHNLIRTWLNSEPGDRKEDVVYFLQVIVTSMTTRTGSLEEDVELLRPRLVDGIELAGIADVASVRFGDNLFSVLVRDHGSVMLFVRADDVAKSDKSFEEWFEIAVANLGKEGKASCMVKPFAGGTMTMIGKTCYGAAQIYLLDRYTELDKTYLVVAPSRDMLLVLESGDISFALLSALLAFSNHVHDQIAEYRISPFIFKYCNGSFEDLTAWDGEQVVLRLDRSDPG